MTNVAIVNNTVTKEDLQGFDFIIAVEMGYKFLKEIGIEPHLVIGDFDSYDIKNIDHDNVVVKEAMDMSDLESAILYARNINEEVKITCFQFEGKRHSHLIAQIRLIINYDITMVYSNSEIFKLKKENSIPKTKYHYISFFSLGKNSVNITNAKYEINNRISTTDSSLYLSNEWLAEGDINVSFVDEPSCVAIMEYKEKYENN